MWVRLVQRHTFQCRKIGSQLIKDKSVTTILNGKKIKDRDEDRSEIIYTTSGSLDKTDNI